VEHRPAHPGGCGMACRIGAGHGRRQARSDQGLGPLAMHGRHARCMSVQPPGAQRGAVHRAVREQQLGQRSVAQSAQGPPGASGGTHRRHAARPHGGLAIYPQQHFAHMAMRDAQQAPLGRPQGLVALAQLFYCHGAQAAQAGRQRAGGLQPAAGGTLAVSAWSQLAARWVGAACMTRMASPAGRGESVARGGAPGAWRRLGHGGGRQAGDDSLKPVGHLGLPSIWPGDLSAHRLTSALISAL
jgi:hypothetical protein